jgi:hypothetical protein
MPKAIRRIRTATPAMSAFVIYANGATAGATVGGVLEVTAAARAALLVFICDTRACNATGSTVGAAARVAISAARPFTRVSTLASTEVSVATAAVRLSSKAITLVSLVG